MNNKKETTTSFAEISMSAGNPIHTGRDPVSDTRVMVYFRGMKVYIPDHFQPDTLRQLFLVLKEL